MRRPWRRPSFSGSFTRPSAGCDTLRAREAGGLRARFVLRARRSGRGRSLLSAGEELEDLVGGLRGAVGLQQPGAGAEAALDLLGVCRIAPVEPIDALHVPV